MAQITEFGKQVKRRLIDIEKPQTWLIDQVKAGTGLYFDDSYLYKIFTGQRNAPIIVQAIREILDMSVDGQNSA